MSDLAKCVWHKGNIPLDRGEFPNCPNCGRVISTKTCEGCKRVFYDWDSKTIDDATAPPSSHNGEFMCQPCASTAYNHV